MQHEQLSGAARLAALANTGMLGDYDSDAMDNIASLAARLLGTPVAVVSLITPDRQLCVGQIGLAPEGERVTKTRCAARPNGCCSDSA